MRIERRSQASEQIGQRILEVAILALAESMPSHVDVTTEEVFLRIQRCDLPALVAGKQLIDHRATEPVQIGTYPVPIMLFQSDFSGLHCSGVRADDAVLFHAMTPFFPMVRGKIALRGAQSDPCSAIAGGGHFQTVRRS